MNEKTKDDLPPDPSRLEMTPEAMRELGYRAVDLLVEHATGLRDKPVWRKEGRAAMEAALREPPPEDGSDPLALLDVLNETVFPASGNLPHPRFYGFIPSPSNWVSVIADLLGAGYNPFAGNWMEASGPGMIEVLVLDWLRELIGMPPSAGGILVSGGSMANLTGLALARHQRLGEAMEGAVVYASDQTHSSVVRALAVLGFPANALRRLPADPQGRLPLDALRSAIGEDRAGRRRPFCVIANAGTTNTGAVDPLDALADLCEAEDLWFHVDGAHGAAAALCEAGREVLRGIERAHSLVIDPHKWLFQPYEVGCLLVREQRQLPEAFHVMPEYLKITEGVPDEVNFMDHGVQLTRSFRALKLWMFFKTFGLKAFRAAIAEGIARTERVEGWLRGDPRWEVLSPAQLAIVCFRYRPQNQTTEAGLDEAALNRLNADMAEALNAEGYAFLSTTVLQGRTVLRLCPINPRTDDDELRETLARLAGHGEKLASG